MEALTNPETQQNFLQVMLEQGGPAVYLIALSAFVLIVVGGERLITLFTRMAANTRALQDSVRARILEKKYTDAIQVCNGHPGAPDIGVMKAGLMAVENGREAMRSALSGAVLQVGHKTEARLQYLSLIANVATLLGLLGTISGLIKTFAAVGEADAATKAQKLGLGISEAMYATAFGLVVGIAAMVVHTICVAKADAIVGDAQDAGHKLVTWVEQSERSGGTA
jgi:biopolymer transport protein ExbB